MSVTHITSRLTLHRFTLILTLITNLFIIAGVTRHWQPRPFIPNRDACDQIMERGSDTEVNYVSSRIASSIERAKRFQKRNET